MSFPNTIHGKYGWEKVQTSGQKHKLGTRMTFDDGRVFRYCEVGGSDIAAGAIVQAPAGVANHDMDLAIATAAAGVTQLTVTLGGTAATKDQYKDGYIYVNDGTGEGSVYKIKSNAAGDSSGTCVITLDEEDGTVTAVTNGNTLVGLAVNPYSNVIISPTTVSNIAVGVAPRALTTNYYGWLQTWGPASVLCNAAGVIGEAVRVGGASTAGGFEDLDRDGTNENEQVIGHQMLIASVATDYALIDLNIAP
tara:strand:- start:966 stop:1715 length:750 start_codon:yes stop_codon:yes gene_type:complete